ncbi:hypothetical protein PV10_06717 [Exophiala mesophila]|uniref:Enoyl reductase (ER) domain-containing protein n=1 Tax=Exophiala mesophila TaxID=212818 RepID=A0A0D1WSU9_EXOME|nr:uncharacterized protein PV10_06717 [Exophiala mesophila]KIV92260.1 hypothetical protein PV10_06717 [Exophiala mesophila]
MSDFTIPCKGIVSYSQHEWKMEDLWTREPREDEFLVEMIATGICHTDVLGYGGIYPRVLGHEGGGRIVKLGSEKQRSQFKEGDFVILSAASCQNCLYCETKHPAYCTNHAALTSGANEANFVLASDTSKVIGGGFFGQSSFASLTPVKVSCASNVSDQVKDAEELKRLAPLGCGMMTGAGAITHVGQCEPDDVVAVVGLGGVGLAAICAAKRRGVKTIIAVDVLESKIEIAKTMGATEGLHSHPKILEDKRQDFPTALTEVTPHQLGCTHILDTSPSVAVLSGCLEALRSNGMVLLVGAKPPRAKLELDILTHMMHGRRLVGVIEGDRDPAEALPELVQWALDGSLPVDRMLTRFPATQFEAAVKGMEQGEVIKSLLIW